MSKLTPTAMQVADAERLLEYDHGLLWSDPGTGKTLTAIEVIERGCFQKALIVCPPIVLTMWASSLETQLGLDEGTVWLCSDGNKLHRALRADAQYIVTTYALAAQRSANGSLYKWATGSIVVLDEAHYCKSHDAKRSRAILEPPLKVAKIELPNGEEIEGELAAGNRLPGFATRADYVLQLTGTPITRYADDLWMQLRYVRADVLEHFKVLTYDAWVRKFCYTKEIMQGRRRVRVVAGNQNEPVLRKLIQACIPVRRTLEEAARELPELTQSALEVKVDKTSGLSQEEIKALLDARALLEDKDQPYAKAWRQLGVNKVSKVIDHIQDIARTQPVLIGVWHKDVSKELVNSLKLDARIIDGSTSQKERDTLIEHFNSGMFPVLIGQIKAMGVGANLQKLCRRVVVLEAPPSPGDMEQFIARVYRKGQHNAVHVDVIVSNDPLDQALTRIRNAKAYTIKEVM